MKYYLIACLLTINIPLTSAPPQSASMHVHNVPIAQNPDEYHKNYPIPTCGEILECIGCCCEAVIIIGLLSLKYVPCKNTHRDHLDLDRERRMH